MTHTEFSDLCKNSKVVSVTTQDYGTINITFDNGIIVEIDTELDYDSSKFSFETNIEKDLEMAEWKRKDEEKKESIRKSNEIKNKIKAKYTDKEWEEIEEAFLVNNGMTFKQNKELQAMRSRETEKMLSKYGNESEFTTWLKEFNK